ncbi:MAG: 3-deoxy-D-manno-octulosonic acid transferase [Alphaproteobacteria bacterium]|nr:3-deoxy-D-manno-octulosonic acid transferase [Alphaproteobacteria bacterium]
MSEPWSLFAYRAAGSLLRPALLLWLARRTRAGKELAPRVGERRGKASLPPPKGPLVWVHAASIGESLSAVPLIDAMASRGSAVLLTTGTVTSAALMAPRLATNAFHQFAPLDIDRWIGRFLDHWRPSLSLRIESEIWPTTITAVAARGIPQLIVNGRLSERAIAGWRQAPGFAAAVFSRITAVGAQSDADADAFRSLQAARVTTTGNIKYAARPLSYNQSQLADLERACGSRLRWLAASIHPGEDAIVAAAHAIVAARVPRPLTIAVPRHPDRASDMAKTFTTAGLKVARRSLSQLPGADVDVYLADTMGELGLFFRLCPIAMMGKSFTVGGGQNPIEPAQLGCALMWGPDMSNFNDVAATYENAGAAIKVRDAKVLGELAAELLGDTSRRTAMSQAASRQVAANAGALERTIALIQPYLDAIGIR